ncbi:SpoIID/LytB domain-containing protein [Metabacillus idriensis]|uniref:SpoIID/LytB domain-containing protein n=1 Tax=Metabacillus idriensis TaxID=324768 RepID=UPI00174AFC03|nr:SpoIID/LytB domain-containing protein [Metabacillus idriensis]
MKKIFLSIVAFMLFFLIAEENTLATSNNPVEVSVQLKNYIGNAKEVTVTVDGEYYSTLDSNIRLIEGQSYKVKNENGSLALYKGNTKIKAFASEPVFMPIRYGTDHIIKINGRPYLGTMKFKQENSQYVRPINELPLEDYLKGVVPGEMPAGWSLEALKAQSASARTYALKRINQTIDDTVSFQKYEGYIWSTSAYNNTNQAVNRTKGQVLKMNGNLIDALYSSSNGGKTENNANVWTSGTPLSYLPAKADSFDPKIKWTISMNENQIDSSKLDLKNPNAWWGTANEKDTKYAANIKKWLQTDNNFAGKDIKIVKATKFAVSNEKTSGDRRKTGSYRIEFYVKNANGTYQMKDGMIETVVKEGINVNIATLRSMFGAADFKSHIIDSLLFENGVYTFTGRGFGHGVGMSQYGAKAMADQKKNFIDITNFYYPGTNYDNYAGQVTEEIAGNDRYETSASIAEFGWSSANTVFIGRGDNPVDALTGSVLAKKYNAPLLLAKTNELPASVKETLSSLNPSNVIILGGQSAISASVESELKGMADQVHRISGAERYDTSAAVAAQVGHSGSVFITSDRSDSPDALSIASYAAIEKMPILYTKKDSVPKAVADYIKTSGVRKITIVGGEAAVSDKAEQQLAALVGETNIDRVSGSDRYETSINIVKKYNLDNRKVFFARGKQFIDALPGSVLAANYRAPIILVERDFVPGPVSSYIYENMTFIPHIHYLGGESAISENTRSILKDWFLK